MTGRWQAGSGAATATVPESMAKTGTRPVRLSGRPEESGRRFVSLRATADGRRARG